MFKDFNNIDREISRQIHNPASRTLQDEFLKNDAEIAADFTYHTYATEEEAGKNSPEAFTYIYCRRRVEDPVRLLMELESSHSLEENY